MGRFFVAAAACFVVTATACAGSGESPRSASDRVRLVRIATLDQPLGMAVRQGDEALYVAQKTGQVVALRDGAVDRRPVVDLSDEVSQGGEQGLLGIAFSPDGARLYTNHTDVDGHTHVTEWTMSGTGADPNSRREVLFVRQPFSNHNGGDLVFGPDEYLYIGLGDGGSGGDPMGNAQSLETMLGKMLRIDPRSGGGDPYTIPPDNPFLRRPGARPEIWAFGLRNPWRYSFDRATGDLWIADVGQNEREEIDRQEAGSAGGENYGWDRLEGTRPFEGDAPQGAVPPVFDYGRERGGTVIGGYVYRGSRIPGLAGAYLFGDFFEPELQSLRLSGGEARVRGLGVSVENLVSFGEDAAGELYALSLSGPVFRIAPPATSS
jgi:glucose/arabinose dehydrogenase